MVPLRCCSSCFGDRGLRRNIFPIRAIETGDCSFCGSKNLPILEPAELTEYFELLVSAYRPDSGGELLVRWFRRDWGIFDQLDDPRAKELLAEILDDGDIVRATFSPSPFVDADRVSAWEELRDELMYRNRFFPNVTFDAPRLQDLLIYLTIGADEIPREWFRARLKSGDTTFTAAEMGAPPKRTASHGRANPAGIPYLYLGSSPTTAVSEIRPHTGETACVATFATPEDLKVVDLRRPRKTVSPFLLVDAEDISKMRNDLPFLERLGEELTTPVAPQAAAVDYTPSQFLCEFIKKCRYDGVIYRSSVSDGINLALFDPARATIRGVAEYQVSRVSVAVTEA
jgi:hypothetical protein